jgi:hypothetical protein
LRIAVDAFSAEVLTASRHRGPTNSRCRRTESYEETLSGLLNAEPASRRSNGPTTIYVHYGIQSAAGVVCGCDINADRGAL